MKKEAEPKQTTFTPDQKRAITTLDRNLCVSAGAGSGKTTVLVERFLYLIEKAGMEIGRIVAITFTEKAANRMKEKIREKMRERMACSTPPKEKKTWEGRCREIGAAWIHTIHGLCTRILKENAVEAGIDPRFITLDETETVILIHKTLRNHIQDRLKEGAESIVNLLSAYGLEKTRSILTLLIQQRVKSLTWCEKYLCQSDQEIMKPLLDARREGEKRIDTIVSRLKVLGAHNPEDGMEKKRREVLACLDHSPLDAKSLHSVAQVRIQGGSRKAWNPDELNRTKDLLKELKTLVQSLLPLYDETRIRKETALLRALSSEAGPLLDRYRKEKESLGVLDFEDLQTLTRDLLLQHREVLERYRKEFSTLLVDEHQDTDPLQMEIVRLLAGEKPGRIFVVGDDKQSIYGFRGADVTVFRDYREEIARQGEENLISLQKNFRSQAGILNFINPLCREIFHTDTGGFNPLLPHRGSLPNAHFVESCFLTSDRNGTDSAGAVRREEASRIAARIREMVDRGEKRILGRQGEEKAVRFGDIAILLRALTDVKLYEEALRRREIPFTVISGSGFFDRQEILDVINLLRVLVQPGNEEALAAILRSAAIGVQDETLYFMTRGRSLSDGFREPEKVEGIDEAERALLFRAREWIDSLRRVRDRVRIPELIGRFLDRTGLPALLLADPVSGRQRYANLRKLMDIARAFPAGPVSGLADFLDYIEELKAREAREGESLIDEEGEETVRILTVHKAKGLEFPVVFLPDLGRKRNGKSDLIEMDPQLGIGIEVPDERGNLTRGFLMTRILEKTRRVRIEEEKRLFYVALTRARDFLVLSGQVKGTNHRGGDSNVPIDWLRAAFGITEENCLHAFSYEGQIIRPIPPAPEKFEAGGGKDSWITRHPEILQGRYPSPPDGDSFIQLFEQSLQAPERQPPRRFTASQLLLYRRCPRKYELARILGISEPVVELSSRHRPGVRGAQLGSLVHRILQQWDFDDLTLDETIDRELLQSGLSPTEREKIRLEILPLLHRFSCSDMAESLREATELRTEVPFLLKLKSYRIEGIIDLFYRTRSGELTVIDYKTDRVPLPEIAARAEDYRFQLALYAWAANRLFRENVETALVFLRPGVVHPVHTTPVETEKAILDTIEEMERISTFRKRKECCPECGYRKFFCS